MKSLRKLSFNADGSAFDVRHAHGRIALYAAGRQSDGAAAAERIGETRRAHDQIALPEAIDAQCLLEGIGSKPVIKNSRAGADRRQAVAKRRPGNAQARREIVLIR